MRRILVATLLAPVLLLPACGGDDEAAAPTTTAPAAITAAPTTVELSTTTTQEATTTTTVEPSTTTTELVLPEPLPPPPARAKEPITALGSLEIPKLRVTEPLLEGITLGTLDRGPGHWPGTALPGHVGNVVIGGHRTSHTRPFRHIDQLIPGDEVILTTLEGRFIYKVTTTKIVTPDAMWIVDQQPTFTATLFACHPVGSTKERIVVFLELQHAPPPAPNLALRAG